MRHVQTIRGEGFILASNGDRLPVRYKLDAGQEEIDLRIQEIPASQPIRGNVQPVDFPLGNSLILELADGRRLPFFFKDWRGTIEVTEPKGGSRAQTAWRPSRLGFHLKM